ncbi:lysophospholipid acyltransferase family protein [Leyella stercorea]|uniref:lysophospholipid acyltransferase family protein n=1 Tax=Leyella stercorea TaxID=363265 RepID=UPI00242E84C4|nr:lysophospholipid acyltransferase family protein [Leyella stercorea]
MKYLYRIYQLLIALPLIAIYTIITSLMVTIGYTLGNGHFWGYYPGKWWAQFIVRILLLPVKVEGRENLVKGQSYVFVANHQGAFDIFLIYGFLSRNFKWMMKRQLRQMPFVGKACESAHHIFVDKRGASKIRETYDRARQTLQGGMSLVVFPEGARSFTGHMGVFKRGAFMLADDIELPVVPLTINGSFDIMPRTRDMKWVVWHPLRLTIHKPILPIGKGTDNIKYLEQESYKVVMSGLEKQYQGFVENPDQ